MSDTQFGTLAQTVWDVIRAMKRFRVDDIEVATGLDPEQIKHVVYRMKRLKYIAPVDGNARKHMWARHNSWDLISDVGPSCPPLWSRDKNGNQRTHRAPPRRIARERIWRAIGVFKNGAFFNYRDIMVTADVTEINARKYLELLLKAGYLREAKPAVKGVRPRTYKVVRGRYTGPRWPKECKEGVYDQHLRMMVYDAFTKKQQWPSELEAAALMGRRLPRGGRDV